MNNEEHFYIQLSKEVGEIAGKLSSLISTVSSMSANIVEIDNRLRQNENETVKTAAKIGLLGILAGGFGTFIMNFVIKHI